MPYSEMVRRRYADMKVGMSRLDAALALHLRCAGYLRKQVEEEMQRRTPAPLQSDSLARKLAYLQRTLDYAFGAERDKTIIDDHIRQLYMEKFNKEVEYIEFYTTHQHLQQHSRTDQEPRMRMR